MQIVSLGDNLHETSKPILWEKMKEKQYEIVVCWICLESGKGSLSLLLKFHGASV